MIVIEKFIKKSKIWDLHIHTCECPKASSEFKGMSTEEYCNDLVKILTCYEDLAMISFTDHNFISKKVYNHILGLNLEIKLIPGIEVDVYFTKEQEVKKNSKHVIFYFDEEKFDYNIHLDAINTKLSQGIPTIHQFLTFLVEDVKVPFVVSPHFLKQNNRGIDDEFLAEDKKVVFNKFSDQLFCFWESAGTNDINKAVEFLKEYDMDKKISIISFSDSNNFDKLRKYLDNPKQYFNALAGFKGLSLVGSEYRRISREQYLINNEEKGGYIGRIVQGENEIEFSNKLNVVVGGRGSGKSLLIDSIYYYTKKEHPKLTTKRLEYLKKLNYRICDMNNNDLEDHDFNIDYFDQGYINKFYEENINLFTSEYLKDEFLKLEDFNKETVKTDILNEIVIKDDSLNFNDENLTSIILKLKKIETKKQEFNFKVNKIKNTLEYKEVNNLLDGLKKPSLVPPELKENDKIIRCHKILVRTIINETYKYNYNLINNQLESLFQNDYMSKVNNHNAERKMKTKTLDLFKTKLHESSFDIIKRVDLINSLLSLKDSYDVIDTHEMTGYNDNKFIFIRTLNVEKILTYLHRMFDEYFDTNKCSKKNIDIKNTSYLYKLIETFCYSPEDIIKDSKNINELYNELKSLDSLKISIIPEIKHISEGKEQLLSNVSPGTKANILMEYIVFKDTNIPLIIDQPEDNIDNRTIFSVLTSWIYDLKQKRQIIVATHDANIVINADAENVIISEQCDTNKFKYTHGALEYDTNIEQVATILDGGLDAIKRRVLKYGEYKYN